MAEARAASSRGIATALIVIAADQVSKAIVRQSLAPGAQRHLVLGVAIVHDVNSGAAFSLFAGSGDAVTVLALVVVAALVVYFARHRGTRLLWLVTGMIVGGAIGNLVDRIRAGGVTDFIKLPDWPAFNLADSAITLGVVGLVLLIGSDGTRRPR